MRKGGERNVNGGSDIENNGEIIEKSENECSLYPS